MKYDWKRPFDDAKHYPLIYSVFESSDAPNEVISNNIFRIEDLSIERFPEAIDLLKTQFLIENAMMSSKNVLGDKISTAEIVEYWRSILDQKISNACHKDGSNEIIGLILLNVTTESEYDFKPNGEAWSEIRRVSRFIKDIFYNPFENYGVEKIITSGGYYVNQNYQHCGIESELVKAISDVGKLFDIRVSSEIFSSTIWQEAASKNEYDEKFSISFKKLPKLMAEGYFPGIQEENLKLYCKKFY
ncbi:unnamed protein product [Chironomus riparius]|uniref:N-acetyltransferase domain-containing protein n=1 Tax=Chironomus riparius TaxID=315576 RepID=A0A9N9RYQ2_9DIPT|nr:unnamed protein product [Chironomus riparius]